MKQLLLLLLFVPCVLTSQNKLKKAKENISQKSKKTNNVRNSSSKDNKDDYHLEYSGFTQFFSEIVFRATIGVLIGDVEERDLNPYPYYYDDEGDYAKVLSNTGRKQHLKLGLNYVSNNINTYDFNVLYKPIPILGLNASHIHFSEKNRTSTDVLDITNLVLNFYRIRAKNISLWWGAGATYVGNGIHKFGFSYNIGADIYPIKPVSLHVSWQESFVNQSEIRLLKTQFKYHIKNKMFFLGYHAYEIANQEIKGPAIGFELIF